MTLPAVISICGDPGGASALAPVLARLTSDRRVNLECYAYNQGFDLLRRLGFAPRLLRGETIFEQIEHAFVEHNPSLVLTATSHNGQDFEKLFIAAARGRGIPSVALLDSWVNYRVRFCDAHGSLQYVPDRIAVMDVVARDGLVTEGIAASAITITGQPAFDALAGQKAAFTAADRDRIRALNGVSAGGVQIMFVSQPLRALYGNTDAPGSPGYHEHSVLDSLIEGLEVISQRLGLRVTLLIRPHPRENAQLHTQRRSEILRILVSTEEDPRAVSMASDLVVGMSSILLIEAYYLGCTVLSFQPNLRGHNPIPSGFRGHIQVIYRPGDLVPYLEEMLQTGCFLKGDKPPHGNRPENEVVSPGLATPRVLECIYSILL